MSSSDRLQPAPEPRSGPDDCPYCHVTDPEARVLLRRPLVQYIEDGRFQGALQHSGVIVPIAHRETVFELTQEELLATFALLADVKGRMDEQFQPQGYNVGWNCGPVAGQTVMHAHMHVIPRFTDEPLAWHGIRSWLKSDANRRPPRPHGGTTPA